MLIVSNFWLGLYMKSILKKEAKHRSFGLIVLAVDKSFVAKANVKIKQAWNLPKCALQKEFVYELCAKEKQERRVVLNQKGR